MFDCSKKITHCGDEYSTDIWGEMLSITYKCRYSNSKKSADHVRSMYTKFLDQFVFNMFSFKLCSYWLDRQETCIHTCTKTFHSFRIAIINGNLKILGHIFVLASFKIA